MISYKVIFKEIASQKVRLFLAILSIAWGTASIAFMLSIGEGLRSSFLKQASGGGNLTLAVQPGYTTKNYRGLPKNTKIFFTDKNIRNFLKIRSVKNISPVMGFSADTRKGKRTAYSSPIATTPNYKQISSVSVAPGGRFINHIDMKESKKVAFIGNQVKTWLFPDVRNPVGMTINLGGTVFTIIGVSKQSMGFSSYGGSISNQVVIPLTTYRVLSNNDSISQYLFLLKKGANIERIKRDVLSIVSSQQKFSPQDKEAINFSDSAKSAQTVNTFLFGFQVFLGIIGGFTLLVSGVGIANIMYMSIKRATRTIGTQMAIGATRASILIHYFIEAIFITLVGGLIGMLSTYGIIKIIDFIPIESKTYTQLGSPKPLLSFSVIFTVIAVLGVIGFLSAFFPAKKASTISPAVALREEG